MKLNKSITTISKEQKSKLSKKSLQLRTNENKLRTDNMPLTYYQPLQGRLFQRGNIKSN